MSAAPLISTSPNRCPGSGEAVFLYRDEIRLRAARWPAARGMAVKGTVLLLHGRSEFIEKYFEVIDDLRGRGFEVLTFDWRGQGLSTRELEEWERGHIDDFQEYLDDMNFIMHSDFAMDLKRPVYMLAHSMGGNIGLRYLHDHPGIVDKAVFCAPMLGIGRRMAQPAVRVLAGGAMIFGRAREEPFVSNPVDPAEEKFFGNPVTSDEPRFKAARASIKAEPRLGLAGLSWQWTDAALQSIDAIWHPNFARNMNTPSLFIGASKEKLVDATAFARFALASDVSEAAMIEGGLHELMMERDKFRDQFFDLTYGFLSAS